MTERARAIPLATLVCIVAALAALRVREGLRAKHELARSTVTSGAVDAGVTSIARAVTPASAATARATDAAEHDASALPAERNAGSRPAERDAGSLPAPLPGSTRMLHGDPRHTHRAAAVGPVRPKLRWTSRIGAPIEAQVVTSADERTLYVAALDGSLTALDAETGAKGWSVPLGERAYATPCVAPGGTIYLGSDAKRFYAVSPKGSVLWKLETDGEADTGAVIAGELVLFAAGTAVFAVRSGGVIAWRFDAKKKIFTAPAIGEGGAVVVGSQDHHVYALSPAGVLLWSADLGADVDGAPAIGDDGSITVGTDAGEIVRLGAGGEVLWRAQVGGYVRGTLSVTRSGDVLAGVYGPTPRVVRVAADGRVTASFAVQGTGSRELGVQGGPLEDARGALFFGAQDDLVHALGPDGAWQWSFTTGGDVDAPMTLLSSGALVAASDDGNVYLFEP